VAVRTLCEFAAKQGDLDLRFTPSPSAQQGIAGHQQVAAGQPAGYLAELPLAGRFRHLEVRGRADGYDPAAQRLDEVKTFKGELATLPPNHRLLHWAQARVYGHLLCQQRGLTTLTLALLYFDVARNLAAPPLTQACTAAELQQFFEALCSRYIDWADQQARHRAQRDAGLLALGFPHTDFRSGQRSLAEAVFKAARAGRCLAAQAPTGIGKTVGTLFPLLKACPGQAIDKVFFLTAKVSGRSLALDALATIQRSAPALPLRVLELASREAACEHPDKQCHGASCPLARGFYDRLPAARAAAVACAATAALSRDKLRAVALDHQVCPYYLGQELVRWCDVVVGDYNHFFDPSALLHAATVALGWRVALLVDEAHNLVERARAMYSATLAPQRFQALRRAAPAALKKPLDRLQRRWRAITAGQSTPYRVLTALPAPLVAALQDALAALGEHLSTAAAADMPPEAATAPRDSALLQGYFDLLQFSRRLEHFGPHSMFDITLAAAAAAAAPGRPPRAAALATLCLRNVVPAPFLKPRLAAAHCSVLFSATLSPRVFYADTLGLPTDTAWLDVAAPFRPEQLAVHIVRSVSTRFADRGRSLAPIADLVAAQFAAQPGNYLAFFSSFAYLQQVADTLSARHPGVPAWRQHPRLAAADREAFLARFAAGGQGIGFAVLGGSFAEGIDLAGSRLIGAFIATLGLPQLNPVNEALRQRLQAEFGAGHDYAYLYPGIRKVVQAAGRVIRGPGDQGSVHLIDDRFARPEVLRLLPAWWRIEGRDSVAAPGPAGAVGASSG
jgi:DNA excision repair protein ERCC-2